SVPEITTVVATLTS
nr:immunoglobulin heavy chain junction region [Mus musculus]